MVSSFKTHEARQVENTIFNKQLLHICIDIEHNFGILKGKWKSLTGLCLILTSEKKYQLHLFGLLFVLY